MGKKVVISKACEGSSGLTGSWRLKKPILDESKCTHCLLCWLYCPEGAILRTEGQRVCINYTYCKGCGICSEVCPSKAITNVEEEQ
jgi:pyruvate ferredoxin oxidoreductase delta subunit